jgi:hypothetical protein
LPELEAQATASTATQDGEGLDLQTSLDHPKETANISKLGKFRKNMEDQGRKRSIKTANSTNAKRSCSIHCASKGMTQIGRM